MLKNLITFPSLLRKCNVVLSFVVLILAIYLIAAPILPKTGVIANGKEWISAGIFHEKRNKLFIESIGINGQIREGDENVLNFGFWHRPLSSTPDKGGNTVIAAHRFLYTYGPNTFFNLDKLRIGDEIHVLWNGITYSYKVIDTKTVESTDTAIENNTSESILTLYTCTSLWDQSQRLVVTAKMGLN